MEYNKDIFNYGILGVPKFKPRFAFPALRCILSALDTHCIFSFDSPTVYCLELDEDGILQCVMSNQRHSKRRLEIVSPEEYISILTGKVYDPEWYKNIEVGTLLRFGIAYNDESEYGFGFRTQLVEPLKEVIISDIAPSQIRPRLDKLPMAFNGDDRVYYVRELNHYFPSSVFIPILEPLKPVKNIELTQISFF